jgi:hypothetical protein
MGCAWRAATCSRIAADGRIGVLCELREIGCPWDVKDVCTHAGRNGHITILDHVVEQGEVLSAQLLTELLNTAGKFVPSRLHDGKSDVDAADQSALKLLSG